MAKSVKSRSIMLKKYEIAYEYCMKKALKSKTKRCIKKSKSIRKPRRKKSVKSLKPLTTYQKFVKKYSKDPSVKKLSPKLRLRAIAKLWKNEK